MEAMTQEFMLHRRPHVEIWSAREGSDDDTSKIHLSNKPLTDPKQCQQRTTDPPQKTIWWISTNHGQSQIPQNWEKNPTIRPLPSSTSETKSDKAQPHHMSIWSTSETSGADSVTNSWQHPTHIWGPEQHMNQTQVFFPGSDYTSYQE